MLRNFVRCMLHCNVRRGATCRSFLYIGHRASCNSPVNSIVGCTLDINSVTTVVGSCTVHSTVYLRITHHHVTLTVYHRSIALHFANGFVAAGGHLKIYKELRSLHRERNKRSKHGSDLLLGSILSQLARSTAWAPTSCCSCVLTGMDSVQRP